MRHYEIVFLVHPDQSEQVSGMMERYRKMVTSNGGHVHREEDWGRRIMAYMINDLHKAHYVLLNIECDLSTLQEIEAHFRFNDSILRHLVIRRKTAIVEQSAILTAKIQEDEAEQLARERKMREDLANQNDDLQGSGEISSQQTEVLATEEMADQETVETAPKENADAENELPDAQENVNEVEESAIQDSELEADDTQPMAEQQVDQEPQSDSADSEVQEQSEEKEAK